MKTIDTISNGTDTVGKRQSHVATFSKVLDGRKQPIRGLWERNGRYYAQITLENQISGEKTVRRVPLKDKDGKPVDTVPQALSEMKRLQIKRTDNELPVLSGVDFMTIAAWVGHKDGGVLIGKVYGHLANEHRKAMAKRVNFEPLPIENAVNA